jgi:YbbR domain-containing protein
VIPKNSRVNPFNFFVSTKDQWILRAISLAIAVILWITVLGGKRIEITKNVSLDYQLPTGIVIANTVPKEIVFRIVGPRIFVKEFQDRNVALPVDLKNAKVGEREFLVRESVLDLPLGLKVSSVSQTVIPIRLDRVAIKRVPVRPNINQNLTEGFKVKSVTVRPSLVEIRGAQSRVNIIEALPTDPITLLSGTLNQELISNLDLRDYTGIQLADVDKSVTVSVELEGELSRKWIKGIPVEIKVKGGPPKTDLNTLGVRVRPAKVSLLVEGPERTLSGLSEKDIQIWAELPELAEGRYSSKLVWKLSPDLRVIKRTSDAVEIVVPDLL